MTCVATLTGTNAFADFIALAGTSVWRETREKKITDLRVTESVVETTQRLNRKDELTPDSADEKSASADLARRLSGREPNALEELYELLAGRAFGLAYRVLNDGPAAEDVVQEAFLWVWNNSDRIDPSRGKVESLLLTVVHRRSIDALRARGRRDALSGTIDIDLIDEKASDLFGSVADSMTHERVRQCVGTLTDEQKQVIELAYYSGLTHREISEEIGIPIGTVKSRIRLGMTRLKAGFGLGGAA